MIGDCHFPYTDELCLYGSGGIVSLVKRIKPHYIIQIGDLYDFFSFSKYPFKRDLHTPEQELRLGRRMASKMWERLLEAHPAARGYQLRGNHDERISKRILERLPEICHVAKPAIDGLYHFKGVKTHESQRDELILDGIMFMHGFYTKLGDHARSFNMPVVAGHSHRGGLIYLPRHYKSKPLWELNCGYIGDPTSVPLSYTRSRQISSWTKGVGVIDELGPRFVHLG
jgi:metallophosphoesterase superfamily enzyme